MSPARSIGMSARAFSETRDRLALVGIAIDRGLIRNASEPILPLIKTRAPSGVDPKVGSITLDHLLRMRSGLGYPTFDGARTGLGFENSFVYHNAEDAFETAQRAIVG